MSLPVRKPRRALVAGLGAWLALAAAGLVAMTAHGAAPGQEPSAPSRLPADSELAARVRAGGRATLVMAAHPGCPCTRASLRELARIVSSSPGAAEVVILFAHPRAVGASPAGAERDRVAADLRALAGAIPGAQVLDDPGGAEASRLGAHTSGTVLLYDRAGALKFSGGVTPSRGHEGDSRGADALRALLRAQVSPEAPAAAGSSEARVYGCPLFDGASER